MQLLSSAGKHETGAKRGKTCNRCQAQENMQLSPSAGKTQPSPSTGKHATVAKHGKTCNCRQALENMQPLPKGEAWQNMKPLLNKGKQPAGAKRGRPHVPNAGNCTGKASHDGFNFRMQHLACEPTNEISKRFKQTTINQINDAASNNVDK